MMRFSVVPIIIISLGSFVSGQQFFFDLDKDTIVVGEPLTLTLEISNPDAVNGELLILDLNHVENLVYDQDTNFLEPNADLEIIQGGALKKYMNGNQIQIPLHDIKQNMTPWRQSIQVSIYSIGVFYIPSPYLDSNIDTSKNKIGNYIFVVPPEGFMQDSTKVINDIKPIIEVETSLVDYIHYLYWILGVILLAFLLCYIYKKVKNKNKVNSEYSIDEQTEFIPEVKEASHIIALRKLNKLQSEKIWTLGRVKAYQSELTDTIREYLEGRFHINALEMTTGEIIHALKSEKFKDETNKSLFEILTVADLVKFAKAQPRDDIHQSFLDQAINFVELTKADDHVE